MIAAAAIVAACTWDNPGADPYRGPAAASAAAALDRYGIAPDVKAELVDKVRLLQPDGTITITRDGIHSSDGTASDLRDMHYAKGMVCAGPVLRPKWKDTHAESALVYCARGECIAIPQVCGNVSRINWAPNGRGPEPEFRAWSPDSPSANSEPAPALPQAPAPQVAPDVAPRLLGRSATEPAQVPEPSALLLAGTALALLALGRRK